MKLTLKQEPVFRRFCVYGFLKNLKFYEPFIILFFISQGFSFFKIGLLISFREICINLFEIPSGTVADIYGRRDAMIFSFLSYIISFLIFAVAGSFGVFLVAMAFFGLGEAFRTGTHKAMIFDYLGIRNLSRLKVQVYGYTRSWSQIGSAVSIIIASLLVIIYRNYRVIFLFSIIPYIMDIINFLGYPEFLNKKKLHKFQLKPIILELGATLKDCITRVRLRALLLEGMLYEGLFKVTKEYLQPLLKVWAISLPFFLTMSEKQRVAILIGLTYFVIYVCNSVAARNSYRIVQSLKNEYRASLSIWLVNLLIFLVIGLFLRKHISYLLPCLCFVVLFILQNLWRPILISRFEEFTHKGMGATILSVESQGKSVAVFFMAPVLGKLVDLLGLQATGWFGLLIVTGVLLGTYILPKRVTGI